MNDLFKLNKQDVYIILDKYTFDYYSENRLDNYTARFTDHINTDYTFKVRTDSALYQLLDKYISFLDEDQIIIEGLDNHYETIKSGGLITKIAEYIVKAKNLETAKQENRSYSIEFFMGSPDDNNALFLYNGIMEVLQPYLDNGVLVCKTGRTSFQDTCILRWSQETAQQWAENYLSG